MITLISTSNRNTRTYAAVPGAPVNQPKAPTDKKSKKKKNPASSKPKTSKIVRESSPIKQVTDTQHAEEPVATDTTKGIESSESAEELRNQTKPVDAEKSAPGNDTLRFITLDVDPENSRLCKDPQHPAHESQTSECPTFTQPHGSLNHNQKNPNDPEIKSLGNVYFEELYGHVELEDRFTNAVADSTLVDSFFLDKKIKEADFDLESMPDDEIMSMSENDEDIDDSEKLSKNDEIDADKVIDELVNMANTKDATLNVFGASSLPISIVYASLSSLGNIQTLIAKMFKDSVKQAIPMFDKRVKKTLKAGVDELVPKPLNKDFNTLNMMERRRFVILQKQLSKAIKKTVGKSVQRSVKKQIGAVPTDIMVINANQLQTKVEKNAADIHELVELAREVVRLMDLVPASARADNKGEKESQAQPTLAEEVPTPAQGEHKTSDDPATKKLKVVMEDIPIPSPTLLNSIRPPVINNNIPFEQFFVNLFSLSSSEFSPIPPPKMTDKGKSKALASDDDKMKQAMPLIKEGGSAPSLSNLHQFKTTSEEELAVYEAKRAKMIKEYNHCISFKKDHLPITKFNYKVKNLKAKFQWVATQVGRLDIPPPPQLSAFKLPSTKKKSDKKRKGCSIRGAGDPETWSQEIFLTWLILTWFFQREEEFHLATTPQLIRIQNAIKKNSAEAKEMYIKLNFVIEARIDVVEARRIVLDNLVKESSIEERRLLEEYSSDEMDFADFPAAKCSQLKSKNGVTPPKSSRSGMVTMGCYFRAQNTMS
ncbi:hypothetical protein Tco_0318628 [Tanacetum coccineum]